MDKEFHPTLYWVWNYLSMLGLKLIHIIKGGSGWREGFFIARSVAGCHKRQTMFTKINSKHKTYVGNQENLYFPRLATTGKLGKFLHKSFISRNITTRSWIPSRLWWSQHWLNVDISWWRHQMETFSALTGPVCKEFTGDRWIPLTKASDAEFLVFSWICAWTNGWVHNREAGDWRCHCAHYIVTTMLCYGVIKIDIIINRTTQYRMNFH